MFRGRRVAPQQVNVNFTLAYEQNEPLRREKVSFTIVSRTLMGEEPGDGAEQASLEIYCYTTASNNNKKNHVDIVAVAMCMLHAT